ncbi:hypothetical protein GCM10025868_09520 [Angustibacter aerolatus]|uniref:Na+/H+ antiporter NhaA n=1 Tax=Angustibacter aerolatus TaxID=1162965 RepID=A0ABQ6JD51_9ACTN|nr:hypothetical protein GCM10025868_09520 [Angustibacter aerolatus]
MALFYTDSVSVPALVVAGLLLAVLVAMRWLRVWRLTPFVLVGLALWVAVSASGVHPTLAGVLMGVTVPAAHVPQEQRDRLRYYGRAVAEAPSPTRVRLATSAARATVAANDRLQEALHPVSASFVVPLFGLANAGVLLDGAALRAAASSSLTLAIVLALLVGNAVGISALAAIALRTRLGDLPGQVRYGHLVGGAVLAGIGFTISLFITDLAFDDPRLQSEAKIGVLTGSLLAAVLGSVLLRWLGERLPLCSVDTDEVPDLPDGPWLDPVSAATQVEA